MTCQIGCEQSELGGRLYLGHNAVEDNYSH